MRERTAEEQARARDIEDTLAGCTGADQFYQTSLPRMIMTEGVKVMADICEAYWLIDLIASHIACNRKAIPDYEFQFWRLELDATGSGAKAYVGDGRDADEGGKGEVMMQAIPFTDFPLDEIKIWVKLDGDRFTMMLPSEY